MAAAAECSVFCLSLRFCVERRVCQDGEFGVADCFLSCVWGGVYDCYCSLGPRPADALFAFCVLQQRIAAHKHRRLQLKKVSLLASGLGRSMAANTDRVQQPCKLHFCIWRVPAAFALCAC
jgi:hypothetical protein